MDIIETPFILIITVEVALGLVAFFITQFSKKTTSQEVPPADNRTVGERVKQALTQQGIAYEEDETAITFEWHFLRWCLHSKDETDYFHLDLVFENHGDMDDHDQVFPLMLRAQKFNCEYKMGKFLIYNDALVFTAQTFVSPGCDINFLLFRALNLLDAMASEMHDEKSANDDDDDDTPATSTPQSPAISIDRILDKMNEVGYDQLTDDEKSALLAASHDSNQQ